MRNTEHVSEGAMVERLAPAPKLFHSYLRKRNKGCPSVSPLKSRYERVVSNVADMSELLANAFSAVFVEDAPPIDARHQNFAGVLDKVYNVLHHFLYSSIAIYKQLAKYFMLYTRYTILLLMSRFST